MEQDISNARPGCYKGWEGQKWSGLGAMHHPGLSMLPKAAKVHDILNADTCTARVLTRAGKGRSGLEALLHLTLACLGCQRQQWSMEHLDAQKCSVMVLTRAWECEQKSHLAPACRSRQ